MTISMRSLALIFGWLRLRPVGGTTRARTMQCLPSGILPSAANALLHSRAATDGPRASLWRSFYVFEAERLLRFFRIGWLGGVGGLRRYDSFRDHVWRLVVGLKQRRPQIGLEQPRIAIRIIASQVFIFGRA